MDEVWASFLEMLWEDGEPKGKAFLHVGCSSVQESQVEGTA